MRRRDFLKLAAVSVGGVGAASVTQIDKLIPFLNPEKQVTPGVATWFATSCRECPAGCGMLLRNREARVVKAEGNPLHPISYGRLCARGQASLQGLYDPDRYRQPVHHPANGKEQKVEWANAIQNIAEVLATTRGKVAIISDLQTGSLVRLMQDWLRALGSDRLLIYEPLNYEPIREANRIVFGQDGIPDYRLDQCDFIMSFAADFLETWVSPVKFAQRFSQTRVPDKGTMSKFVYVGPRASMTALNADEIILVKSGDERLVALSILSAMVSTGTANPGIADLHQYTPERLGAQIGVEPEKIQRLARNLTRAKSPVVLAGAPISLGRSAIESSVAANLLNIAAGSTAIDFSRTHALSQTARYSEIASFVDTMANGEVEALIILRSNPAYSMLGGLHFAEALKQVPLVVSLSPFVDETAVLSTWVLPSNTPLESWGDYEPESGIVNLMQPVMGNLFDTMMEGDILMALAKEAGINLQVTFGAENYQEYVQRYWAQRFGATSPWQTALERGGYWTGETTARAVSPGNIANFRFSPIQENAAPALWLYPSALLYDGRGANKRWLQELPDVVHHIVWGSWAEIHPDTAEKLRLQNGKGIEIAASTGKINAPVVHYKGIHPDVIAVPIGQGHTAYGRYAKSRGVNAFQLLDIKAMDIAVSISPHLTKETIVSTDGSVSEHGRDLIQSVMLSQLSEHHPEEIIWPLPKGYNKDHDLYTPHSHLEHRWAMVIDMSRCIGCEACMAACYAENNLAVVGKNRMAQGREMEWIWIDRYYDWESEHTPAQFLVMLCQHCDSAPCEPVCPVFAAAHSQDGLNAQIYNRCIGTRYCSHNCPYKVRRFNWLNYEWPEPLNWQLNPDVTVRERGVMEKCTFCVQRIRDVEYRAKKENRPIRDGEIVPACAQTCPANVFVFGDLMDPKSQVSKLMHENPRRYQVLKELNTKPAVIYLQKVINDREEL